MREDLLGYLMGALDEAERAKVQAALEVDPVLAAECARLEQAIAPLSEDESWIDPPRRLADRTVGFVEAYANQADACGDATVSPVASETLPDAETCASPALSPAAEPMGNRPRRWTLADAIVAVGICAAAAMLFFPAIANSQRQAAVVQCQNNLRQIGHALVDYSYDHDRHFPLVPASGNLSIAGIYAPLLKENKRIEDDNVFLCPTSELAQEADTFRVPDMKELLRQEGKTLLASQRKLGGSYGYAFGYEDENGVYRPNINRSRPRFAILADSPSLHLKDRRSANHDGNGQNVLFEDNHVEYLTHCRAEEASDNVFLSDRGYVEAGRHWNDAVIGNSWARPVLLTDTVSRGK